MLGHLGRLALVVAIILAVTGGLFDDARGVESPQAGRSTVAASIQSMADAGSARGAQPFSTYFPAPVILLLVFLVSCSAFFSGSETAFLSISQTQLRSLSEQPGFLARLLTRLMSHVGRLLTTILVGNTIVNVLIGIVLGARMVLLFEESVGLAPPTAYICGVLIATGVLLFFGEITPKVLAVGLGERFALAAALPLYAVDRLLGPVRDTFLGLTDFLFRVTHFSDLHAAPFMTDEEFKALLSHGESQGVIEGEKRQMIQGILEFTDATVREIIVPRPDVIAVEQSKTIAEALELVREHEYARIPVYNEDIDHIIGMLFAKDLLPAFTEGNTGMPVSELVRPAHFVPETMSIYRFVKEAQRLRTHIAVVVDEYGGTEGIVTLEDALEEVVGEMVIEDDPPEELYEQVDDHTYRVDGGLSLDILSDLVEVKIEDEEHETVAGFVMSAIDKIPEPGDTIEYTGVHFVVEAVEGKRVATLRVRVTPPPETKEDKS